MSRIAGWFLLLVVGVPSACCAQSERYELGKRLRRFELAWQTADAEARKASTTAMQRAVQSFFGLQLSTAARYLDEAHYAVTAASPSDFERKAISLRLDVKPVLLEAGSTEANMRLRPFYKLPATAAPSAQSPAADQATTDKGHLPAETRVQLQIRDSAGINHTTLELVWSEASEGKSLQLEGIPAGDLWFETSLSSTSETVSLPAVQLSVVDDLSGRLTRLEAELEALPPTTELNAAMKTLRATVRQTTRTLRAMADGRPQETDFPAASWLELAEKLLAEPEAAATALQQAARESTWMVLSNGRSSLPVRVHMPEVQAAKTKSEGQPILFAFHGAGGSENMFFETYGAGRLIELASQRGWIVVAPRHPLLGMPFDYREMIELLKPLFPIDEQRVFLVGHSMGAGEVVRQLSGDLKPPQAAVAIGGGGRSADNAATRQTPWLVAAGELDFGRGGARGLATRLEAIGANVQYRDYPDVEHMVIVQAAVDDVFEFLDQQ